jgi:hypothetical protein
MDGDLSSDLERLASTWLRKHGREVHGRPEGDDDSSIAAAGMECRLRQKKEAVPTATGDLNVERSGQDVDVRLRDR